MPAMTPAITPHPQLQHQQRRRHRITPAIRATATATIHTNRQLIPGTGPENYHTLMGVFTASHRLAVVFQFHTLRLTGIGGEPHGIVPALF